MTMGKLFTHVFFYYLYYLVLASMVMFYGWEVNRSTGADI